MEIYAHVVYEQYFTFCFLESQRELFWRDRGRESGTGFYGLDALLITADTVKAQKETQSIHH